MFQNDYILETIKKQQVKEYIQQAEKDRLAASLKPHRPHPIGQFFRSVLRGTGHLFVTVGRRLEGIQAPQNNVRMGNATPSK